MRGRPMKSHSKMVGNAHGQADAFARSGPDRIDHTIRLPTTQDEKAAVPIVWFVVVGLVAVGALVNIFLPGGIVVWPFVFALSLLLIVNDVSDRHGVGVPPFSGVRAVLRRAVVSSCSSRW
jgi:hypothetical protein